MGRQSEYYDDKNLFISEEGNRIRLPSEFFYDKISLKIYEFHGKYHEAVICANYPHNSNLYEFTKPVECKKPDLLCGILKLRENLSDELFKPEQIILCDIDIRNDEINYIIEWCKKYGFPFKPSFENQSVSTSLFEKIPSNQIGFKVWEFIKQLNDVYSAYLLYEVITDIKIKSLNKTVYISRAELYTENGSLAKSAFNKFITLDLGMNKDECRKVFENKYQEIIFTNLISFRNGEMRLTVKTDNLFDAAFYQLALLLNGSTIEISKCPLCFEFFYKDYARQKYCLTPATTPDGKIKYKRDKYGNTKYDENGNKEILYTCYPQRAHKKTKAKNKKMAVNHNA